MPSSMNSIKFIKIIFILVVGLALVLLLLGNFVGYSVSLDREKSSPFECGFTPHNIARLPFSFRFFLLAIVFLIFDVELVLIFPVVATCSIISGFIPLVILLVFVLALLAGLFYELNQGRLN
jgi:NADH-ubiquinone oxidoreductase chain 3